MTHHVNNTIMKIDYEIVIQQKERMNFHQIFNSLSALYSTLLFTTITTTTTTKRDNGRLFEGNY